MLADEEVWPGAQGDVLLQDLQIGHPGSFAALAQQLTGALPSVLTVNAELELGTLSQCAEIVYWELWAK